MTFFYFSKALPWKFWLFLPKKRKNFWLFFLNFQNPKFWLFFYIRKVKNYDKFLREKNVFWPINCWMDAMNRRCGQQFLCRRGDRGPCQRNEVFVDRPKNASDVNAVPKDSCLNFNSNSWNGCHKMPKEVSDHRVILSLWLLMGWFILEIGSCNNRSYE